MWLCGLCGHGRLARAVLTLVSLSPECQSLPLLDRKTCAGESPAPTQAWRVLVFSQGAEEVRIPP